MVTSTTAPDVWFVDENALGPVGKWSVKDENGLLVCYCASQEAAETMVRDRAEHRALWLAAHKPAVARRRGARAYEDVHPTDINPETNRPYDGYSSPSLDTSFHDHEMDV